MIALEPMPATAGLNVPKELSVIPLPDQIPPAFDAIKLMLGAVTHCEPGSVILNPGEKLCSTESSVKLTDEIGIKELDSLYYDLFDYNTKTWSKRSNKMKKKI